MNPRAHLNAIAKSFNYDFLKAVESYVNSLPFELQSEANKACLDCLPGGEDYQPTDEELVGYLLSMKNKGEEILKKTLPSTSVFGKHPEDLVEKYPLKRIDNNEWYFFTPKPRKDCDAYRRRLAGYGYWEATTPEVVICDTNGTKIGVKSSFAYYDGIPSSDEWLQNFRKRNRPPNGTKTDWKMEEYVGVLDTAFTAFADFGYVADYIICKIWTSQKIITSTKGKRGYFPTFDYRVGPRRAVFKDDKIKKDE